MGKRLRAWLVILGVLPLSAGAIWLASYYRSRNLDTSASLLARLPGKDAVIVYIDFAALKRAGLFQWLASSRAPEEADYRQFVGKTEFDYKEDLSLALASFGPTGTFLLLRGRFDWNRLHAYVTGEGGDCYNSFCRMTGSTQDRKISFFPIRTSLMALAVSNDADSASRLMTATPNRPQLEIPNDPVWISLPPSTLLNAAKLPDGTRPFVRSLADAEAITVSLGPQGQGLEARLNVRCRSEQQARTVARQLEDTTSLLRRLIAQEQKTPNPRDLSGVLAAGTFSHADRHVSGRWPVAQAFLEETLSGGSQ